jgi:branched-subunit amino acid ABC-type transport system permease component
MTAETIVQSLLSGLLTGLVYALIAVGFSLICRPRGWNGTNVS